MKNRSAFLFVLLFSGSVSASDCPENWKAGDEFLYPSHCRPQNASSPWSVDQTEDLRRFDLGDLPTPPATAEDELISDTKYLAAFNGAMIGLMSALPSEVTNWAEHNETPFAVWEKHLYGPPHIDHDSWKWNYVAHPIAGASYYRICREREKSIGQCYLYSFLVSAILWEYGWEATREQPSIQDLIITPTAGALLGEIATQLSNEIRTNDGRVLGSPAIGKAVLALLNPVGSIIDEVRNVIDPLGQRLNSRPFFRYGTTPSDRIYGSHSPLESRRRVEIGVTIKLQPGWERKLLGIF